MFTNERTGIAINANLSQSVIYSTLRNCDIIPAFLDVISNTPEYAQFITGNHSHDMNVIFDQTADERDERWNSEDVNYFLNEELWPILDSYAPDGYYFGSNEGDGSDFGYWSVKDSNWDD